MDNNFSVMRNNILQLPSTPFTKMMKKQVAVLIDSMNGFQNALKLSLSEKKSIDTVEFQRFYSDCRSTFI
jgi:hypothetical protein